MPAANTSWIDKVRGHAGQLFGVPVDYVGPASYTAVSGSGETITAQQLGLKNIYAIGVCPSGSGTYAVYPMFTTNKAAQSVELMWVVIATGAEVAGAVDLSAQRVRLMVWGN